MPRPLNSNEQRIRTKRKKPIVLERINKNTILNSNGPLTGSHGGHVGSSSPAIGGGHEFRIRM